MCNHSPACPSADSTDHAAARVIAHQDDVGWSLLCNGVIVFDDTGEILPGGATVAPLHRGNPLMPTRRAAASMAA